MVTGDDYLGPEGALARLVEDVASGRGSLASGSAAAAAGCLAAALVAMAARCSRSVWPDADRAIAEAEALRARLLPSLRSDASAYGQARALLGRAEREREHGDAHVAPGIQGRAAQRLRDKELAQALEIAATEPLEIAEAAAEVAGLASSVAASGSADQRADAVGAAMLAEAAACAAAHLVQTNLSILHDDMLAVRARTAAAAATAARQRALSLGAD